MAKTAKVKFEEALERVEKAARDLVGGQLPLDESLARYEEGVKALKQCYEILRDAEKRVEILVQGEDGKLTAAPFSPEPAKSEGEAGEASAAEETT